MFGVIESLIFGVCIGSVIGTCIGVCLIIRKHYIDKKNHETDVENITKNILHTLDEKSNFKVDYITSRPIV